MSESKNTTKKGWPELCLLELNGTGNVIWSIDTSGTVTSVNEVSAYSLKTQFSPSQLYLTTLNGEFNIPIKVGYINIILLTDKNGANGFILKYYPIIQSTMISHITYTNYVKATW